MSRSNIAQLRESNYQCATPRGEASKLASPIDTLAVRFRHMGDINREADVVRGVVWCMRRSRVVRTPYGLAVALGLLDELHARPSALQEDAAVQLLVKHVCGCVPDLKPLAVEAALFAEIDFGSSVVAKERSRAV